MLTLGFTVNVGLYNIAQPSLEMGVAAAWLRRTLTVHLYTDLLILEDDNDLEPQNARNALTKPSPVETTAPRRCDFKDKETFPWSGPS